MANPHDAFFKTTLSERVNALDYFQTILPSELKAKLDFRTLKLEKTSWVDEQLKQHFSDLVYSCRYGKTGTVKLTFLLEHKSYPEAYPHLQLLRYMLRIWEHQVREKTSLTPIIPIIFYHGRTHWNVRPLADYFSLSDPLLQLFVPEFQYLLTDLSRLSDEEIKLDLFDRASLKFASLVLKNIHDEAHIKRCLSDYFDLSRVYFADRGSFRFLEVVIRYLLQTLSDVDASEIVATIRKISEKGGDLAMSIATKLREEGIKIGHDKGKMEEKEKTALKMLQRGLELKLIIEITGLNSEQIAALEKSPPSE